MGDAIYLVDKNGELVRLTKSQYDSEAVLQGLLAKYPDLLSGEQINPASPCRWLFIAREVGIPCQEEGADRWSLDHLFLDQDGIPTLIEVKRSSDTRIRREVVGQMLDYAANVVSFWPIQTIVSKFESACEQAGKDADQVLSEFLNETLQPGEFWERTETNLRAGKVRMIFVADEIPEELKTIVEFLNGQMDPAEVIAIEVPQFEGQGLKTLVPRVYGQTSQSEAKKTSVGGYSEWNEERFFAELAKRTTSQCVDVARDILDWIRSRVAFIWWGRGKSNGSFVPVLRYDRDYSLFAAWTYGTVEIYFQWYSRWPPFDSEDKRMEMLRRLNEIPGVSLPPESISKRPGIRMDLLTDAGALEKFKAAFEWYIEEVKKA
jgi:hypothetical protein